VAFGQVDLAFHLTDAFGPVDFAGLASLFALPFAHEDLAIVFGAYAIVSNWLPAGLVVLCIYAGMVAADFALYGVGAGARRIPWLNRLAIDDRVRKFGQSLDGNVFGLFALCRLAPGTGFIAFVACGWTQVSLVRFAVASLVMAALYLPMTLYLVVVFGAALEGHIGLWSWPVLLAALAAMTFVRRRVFGFGSAGEAVESRTDQPRQPRTLSGTARAAVGVHRNTEGAGYAGRVRVRSFDHGRSDASGFVRQDRLALPRSRQSDGWPRHAVGRGAIDRLH